MCPAFLINKKRKDGGSMTVDVAVLISVVSVGSAVIFGITNMRRNKTADDMKEATQMTTVICKLENIADDTKEIKSEIKSLKAEVQDLREKTAITDQATKSLHKRVDVMEVRLNELLKKEEVYG